MNLYTSIRLSNNWACMTSCKNHTNYCSILLKCSLRAMCDLYSHVMLFNTDTLHKVLYKVYLDKAHCTISFSFTWQWDFLFILIFLNVKIPLNEVIGRDESRYNFSCIFKISGEQIDDLEWPSRSFSSNLFCLVKLILSGKINTWWLIPYIKYFIKYI